VASVIVARALSARLSHINQYQYMPNVDPL
jgi:hypothetical protein